MCKKALTVGAILSILSLICMGFSLFPSEYHGSYINIVSYISLFIWIYINNYIFSSRQITNINRIIILYFFPLVFFLLGAIGTYTDNNFLIYIYSIFLFHL